MTPNKINFNKFYQKKGKTFLRLFIRTSIKLGEFFCRVWLMFDRRSPLGRWYSSTRPSSLDRSSTRRLYRSLSGRSPFLSKSPPIRFPDSVRISSPHRDRAVMLIHISSMMVRSAFSKYIGWMFNLGRFSDT